MAFYIDSVTQVTETLDGVLQNLPAVVEIHASDNDDNNDEYGVIRDENEDAIIKNSYGIPDGTKLMLQRIVKAEYARIRFTIDSEYIVPIDSKTEHTNGGHHKEYLIPLACGAQFQYTRRPGNSGTFNTILELLQDPPCLVEVIEDCYARMTQDMSKRKKISAHSVLELKRTFTSIENDKRFLECSFNNMSVAIEKHRNIPTKAIDNTKTYLLLDLKKMLLFPKFINFLSSVSNDVVLRDYQIGDELYTKLEGPIEVLGVQEVNTLVAWVRHDGYRSYETVLIPSSLWNTMKVRQIHFPQMDCARFIQERYKHCLNSNSIQTSMFVLPADLQEATWLRLSDMFARKGCKSTFSVPDDVQLQFEDSADDSTYATMEYVKVPTSDTPAELNDEDNTHKIENTRKTPMMQKIQNLLPLLFRKKDKKESKQTKAITNTPRAEFDKGRYTDMMTLADCFSAECNKEG